MTRCILVGEIVGAGYSVITAAQLLEHTPQAIRHLLEFGYRYHRLSRAYRIGEVWAVLLCMKIEPGGERRVFSPCLILVARGWGDKSFWICWSVCECRNAPGG